MTITKIIKHFSWPAIFACLLLFSGCNGEDGIIGTGIGFAQKGPYITGARVVITEIDSEGIEQPDTMKIVLTKDDLGNFDFDTEPDTTYKVIIYGKFLNEITGVVTDTKVRLSAIYYTRNSDSKIFGVNMLTTLTTNRIISLIQNGTSPADAILQAQGDVTHALNAIFPTQSILTGFNEMNLFNVNNTSETGNAYLLTVSSSIYKAAIIESAITRLGEQRTLGRMISQLISDLDTAGTFSNALVRQIIAASYLLDPDIISDNLERLSNDVLGFSLSVANMDLFLDTDADGIINHQDDDIDNDGVLNNDDTAVYDPLLQ